MFELWESGEKNDSNIVAFRITDDSYNETHVQTLLSRNQTHANIAGSCTLYMALGNFNLRDHFEIKKQYPNE